MPDEFINPVRSLGRSVAGSWNAYDLWRTTIEVPRKVQRVDVRDQDDIDDDPRYARRKAVAVARKVAGAIVLLLLLAAPFVSGRSDACVVDARAATHAKPVPFFYSRHSLTYLNNQLRGKFDV